MSVCGIIRGQNKMKNCRIGQLRYPIAEEKELDREFQLGPSLACQPKAPTSECLLPSIKLLFERKISLCENMYSDVCLNEYDDPGEFFENGAEF